MLFAVLFLSIFSSYGDSPHASHRSSEALACRWLMMCFVLFNTLGSSYLAVAYTNCVSDVVNLVCSSNAEWTR